MIIEAAPDQMDFMMIDLASAVGLLQTLRRNFGLGKALEVLRPPMKDGRRG
jgi:hypothetical protein